MKRRSPPIGVDARKHNQAGFMPMRPCRWGIDVLPDSDCPKLWTLERPNMRGFTAFLENVTDLPRFWKRAMVFAIDVACCALASIVAYSLRMGVWAIWNPGIGKLALVSVLIMVPVFLASPVYSAIFRFAGRGAFKTLFSVTLLYSILFVAVIGLGEFDGIPKTAAFIQPIVFFGFLTNSRLIARFLLVDVLHRGKNREQLRTMLIYGAGSAGQRLAASLDTEPDFKLVGYIDDDRRLAGQSLDGVPVYHSPQLESVIEKHSVTDILLSLPELNRTERTAIVQRLSRFKVHVQLLPPLRDIVSGRVSVNDLREVGIDDLLGREPVQPIPELIEKTVRDKCVLVSGAGGSIGSDLCRQILDGRPRRLVLVERSEYALYAIDAELRARAGAVGIDCTLEPVLASVSDATAMAEVFARQDPQTVFHAAAYKHVPLVEANVVEGVYNNVIGTRVIAETAVRHGVGNFILISTDKAVRPTNVMGASKRAAELVVHALAMNQSQTVLSMVRFGNVLDSSGSVVPLFRSQIAAGGPITLTHRDVVRYFMTIPEAAQLVLQAAGMAQGGEVYVLDMGESVKIGDLARSMINLSGLSVRDEDNPGGDIEIVEIGLRPGEKMFEELLIGENPEPTRHARILRATETALSWEALLPSLDTISTCRDTETILAVLKHLVPDFAHDAPRRELEAVV